MSHIDAGPLPAYNSLMDPHLSGYFGNRKMRKHLRKQGLISRQGEIVSENTYRLNMARKEHKNHVREMLAQAIVHKTLDMERARQVQIKRKLEEIAKIELVRRVQSDRGRKGDEDLLPYLTQGELESAIREYRPGGPRVMRPASVPSSRGGRRGRGGGSARPVSAPGPRKTRRPKTANSYYVDEDGLPVNSKDGTPGPRSAESRRTQSAHASRRATSAKYPTDEIDSRHLHGLNQQTLHEYTQLMNELERGRGPSIYSLPMMEAVATPRPPPGGGPPRSHCKKSSRRRVQHTDALGRPIRFKDQSKGYLLLHRTEPAMKHQERVQTLCDVTMHYFGSPLKLDYERSDPRDEIMIQQQHCGGNALVIFREQILPHTDFTFTSRRHRGFPFSLTFFINGVQDCRLSTCCEYKHARGARIGGKAGKFAVLGVDGAAPCYRCQISGGMRGGSAGSKKKKKNKNAKKEDDEDKENKKADSDEDYEDEDFSDEEEEERESAREKREAQELDVRGLEDDEDKNKKYESKRDKKNRDRGEEKKENDENNEEDAKSSSSSSSSSSSDEGSDAEDEKKSQEDDAKSDDGSHAQKSDDENQSQVENQGDDERQSPIGGTGEGEGSNRNSPTGDDSPREGAVSPLPDVPKITVTSQDGSSRSYTSETNANDADNGNEEEARPVTRIERRDYSSDDDDKKSNASDASSKSSRSSRSSKSSTRSRSSSGSRSRSSSRSGDESSKKQQSTKRDSDSD